MAARFKSTAACPKAVHSAWSGFVSSGKLDPGCVRDPVARAWQRSASAGCDPRMARADVLPPEATLELVQKESKLIEIATPFMMALSRAAGQERHAAMLGDGVGRVLKIVGDHETIKDEGFPRAGSLLSEENAGANGIGTPLAEGAYVELVGPEHFIEGFHAFTCQGVPLLGSTGAPAGVLSVSVRTQSAAVKVRDILFCASEAAQCELLSEWLSDTLYVSAPSDRVLELLRQDVVQRIASTRLRFEIAARQIAAGADASSTLDAARTLITGFRRQASIWRSLVDERPGRLELIPLADVTRDFMSLIDTEARIAGVSLRLERVDRVSVVEEMRLLSRRLLRAFLDVLQDAAPGSEVEVSVAAAEGVGFAKVAGHGKDGRRLEQRVRCVVAR